MQSYVNKITNNINNNNKKSILIKIKIKNCKKIRIMKKLNKNTNSWLKVNLKLIMNLINLKKLIFYRIII